MIRMPNGIDHVLIAVADPDASAAELTEKVGLAFTGGGRHLGLGTHNRIAFLGDAYLELIGVEDAAAAQGWAIGAAAVRALEHGGGFATYALVDEAIRVTVPRLQANASSIGPVEAGSRERPDGDVVEWLTATPPVLGPDRPPFLIKHLETGAEWGPDALAARRAFVHPIGSPAVIERLDIAVADPQALAADCYRDLGLEFWAVGSMAVCSVGRHVIRLIADEQETTIVIGAAIASPRSVPALGLRFEVLPATLPMPPIPTLRLPVSN
jgi:catechol 2,3-dioxygenase-like lactoylglutathione lyase family enzyme